MTEWKYNGAFTREQFLFYEMRTAAKLLSEGLTEQETVDRIVTENLFQYKTEKSIRRMAKSCITRLKCMDNPRLIEMLAGTSSDTARQICLYAMMRQYRVIYDFMVLVIGEKYQHLDLSFSKSDVSAFFNMLQEQDDNVASWSENTITKLKQVIVKLLVDNKYLDNRNSERLNPVLLSMSLEQEIKASGDSRILKAFNCLS